MSDPLLVSEGLTKVFRRRLFGGKDSELRAVDEVSFAVARGTVYGFLGPNGAGKSTTIRLALGLIHPTAGRVTIGGHDVATQRLRALRKVGAFVETPSFYPYLSGRKNLEIFAGLSGGATPLQIEAALELVGLRERAGDKVKVYSHGMKARLGLAGCLLPRPELLILDEPTDGLDPHGIREVRTLIRRLAGDEGLTVFLSSHMLGEVENLCTHIAILERGRLILQGALEELERTHRRYRIEVDRTAEAAALLREKFGLECRSEAGERKGLLVPLGGRPPEALCAALSAAGFGVRVFAPEQAWLDRLFLELTTSRESDRGPAQAEDAA
jgi:ABC-2 type transport system ATP-binding protein